MAERNQAHTQKVALCGAVKGATSRFKRPANGTGQWPIGSGLKKKRERPFLNRERTSKRPFRFLERTARTPKRRFGFWCGLHGHQSGHFSRWCGLHGHQKAIGHFSRWCGQGIRRLKKTREKSVVTRTSFRGRPAALLSPRGSSSGLFFLGLGRAPGGYSHTPNNTHNRPRCTLARARPARNDDQRESARQGRRPATEEKEKHHTARGILLECGGENHPHERRAAPARVADRQPDRRGFNERK